MNSWTKSQLCFEFAKQIREYDELALDTRMDDPRFAFYQGQAQAIYDLALKFDIWAFDINPYLEQLEDEARESK